MKSIIAACCMLIVGSVTAHADRLQCLLQCDSAGYSCKQPCGADTNCNARCYQQQNACARGCN
jgi:hypothetical protein